MLTPGTIALLRRSGAWDAARGVHQAVSPRLCRTVHRAVLSTAPERLPRDLRLKHRFDGEPVWVAPDRIVGMIRVGEWNRPDELGRGRTARFRRWWIRGGGHKSVLRHLSRNVHGRFVVGGDWDRSLRPFQLLDSVRQILDGVPAQDTDEYQRVARWIVAGDLRWTRGCRTLTDLDRYFDELVASVDSIRNHGYRTQQELGNDGGDEIRVCIDRDGQLSVFGGGTHRLSIAMLLGLDRVPVTVKRVHSHWVALQRRRFATTDDVTAIELGVQAISCDARGLDRIPAPTRSDEDQLRGAS